MEQKRLDKLEKTIKEDVCRGCDQDRYNHKGMCERPGIDAPVTSNRCWLMTPDNIDYDRRWKRYYCKAGRTNRNKASRATVMEERKMDVDHRGNLIKYVE